MKILTIPFLLLILSGKAQDFKDFYTAHIGLERAIRYSSKSIEAHLSGTVLLSSMVIKGELTNIKTLFADSYLLEADAIKSLQKTSGRWKFCKDSTMIVVPYSFYYMGDSYGTIDSNARILDNIQHKEVISGTILPAIVCMVTVSACKMVE